MYPISCNCQISVPVLPSVLQMEDDSIYNMSQRRGYPVPPPLPGACNAEPSELYQVRISVTMSHMNCSDII